VEISYLLKDGPSKIVKIISEEKETLTKNHDF
jgi:hypothetical protein